jgi:hypothetical protein
MASLHRIHGFTYKNYDGTCKHGGDYYSEFSEMGDESWIKFPPYDFIYVFDEEMP